MGQYEKNTIKQLYAITGVFRHFQTHTYLKCSYGPLTREVQQNDLLFFFHFWPTQMLLNLPTLNTGFDTQGITQKWSEQPQNWWNINKIIYNMVLKIISCDRKAQFSSKMYHFKAYRICDHPPRNWCKVAPGSFSVYVISRKYMS